jgi:murein DD-endopeptidase MepM/ murein hydrolase activator NlpD
MKKILRSIALLTLISLMTSLFVSCGDKKSTGEDGVKKTVITKDYVITIPDRDKVSSTMAKDLKDDIEDAQDAYDEAEYQQWLSTSKPGGAVTGGGGASNTVNGITWIVPCKYKRVSSAYGWRIHPVYGYKKFHYGIDLAANQGTPIVASRSGKVIKATYDSSAGYFVTIDHGDGFSSKYLHMTHYIVKKGDYVTAGQVIGYVGSTGASTGPHLHFGILYKGEYVNPANYIKV